LYRIASLVLVLFATGHFLGFRTMDPHWGADAVVAAMRSIRFKVGSFNRGYWDFYLGAGYFVTAFLLFAAVLAWQLGGLKKETLRLMPLITWGLAVCFAGVTLLSWKYLFLPPIVFSSVLTGILVAAAGVAGRESVSPETD
jgi:intracellular septation protein A